MGPHRSGSASPRLHESQAPRPRTDLGLRAPVGPVRGIVTLDQGMRGPDGYGLRKPELALGLALRQRLQKGRRRRGAANESASARCSNDSPTRRGSALAVEPAPHRRSVRHHRPQGGRTTYHPSAWRGVACRARTTRRRVEAGQQRLGGDITDGLLATIARRAAGRRTIQAHGMAFSECEWRAQRGRAWS